MNNQKYVNKIKKIVCTESATTKFTTGEDVWDLYDNTKDIFYEAIKTDNIITVQQVFDDHKLLCEFTVDVTGPSKPDSDEDSAHVYDI